MSAPTDPVSSNLTHQYDPTFLHARREALLIFLTWALCLCWAVPYCYYNGYLASPDAFEVESLDLLWGIPSWVFYGIAIPWLLADVVTVWLCFFYMQDDPLGEEEEPPVNTNEEGRATA